MSEEEFSNENLAKTKDDEELYPVLVAEDGEVLDGKHRVEAKPKWHKKTVQAKTRLEKILVRVKAHYRRRVPREETQALILEVAHELEASGVECRTISSELANMMPYSAKYIQTLLPEKYKQPEKIEAGKIGAEQKKQLSSKPSPINHETFVRQNGLVECEIGKHLVDPARTTMIEGHVVCNMHRETGKNRFTPKQETKPETKEYKPTETWEYRKARMQVSPSKMDEALYILLQNDKELKEAGFHIEFQKQYVKILCVADCALTHPKLKNELAVFNDQVDIHKDKDFEDETRRNEAAFLYGLEILALPYHVVTETEKSQLKDAVKKKAFELLKEA